MRKFLAVLLMLALALPLVSLAGETYELALVTDIGTINDKSFNQGTWEGLVAFAEANNKTYNYYQPTGQSTDTIWTLLSRRSTPAPRSS